MTQPTLAAIQYFSNIRHHSHFATWVARNSLSALGAMLLLTIAMIVGPSASLAGSKPSFEGKVEANVSLQVDKHGWRQSTAGLKLFVQGDRWSAIDGGGNEFGGRVSRSHKRNKYNLELDSHARSRLESMLQRAVEDERRERVEVELEKVKITLKLTDHQLKFKMKIYFEIDNGRHEFDGKAKIKVKADLNGGGFGDRGTCHDPMVTHRDGFKIEACVDRLSYRPGEKVNFYYWITNESHRDATFQFANSLNFRFLVTDAHHREVYPGTQFVSPAFTTLSLPAGHTQHFSTSWNQTYGRGIGSDGHQVHDGRYYLSGSLPGYSFTASEPIGIEIGF